MLFQAYDIVTTVGQAFQICAEEIKARKDDPFAAQAGEVRERLSNFLQLIEFFNDGIIEFHIVIMIEIEGNLRKKQIHRSDLKAIEAIGAGQVCLNVIYLPKFHFVFPSVRRSVLGHVHVPRFASESECHDSSLLIE